MYLCSHNLASTSNADPQYGASDSAALRLKVRKNKDGRPRKRSQHTKGNKLWEFIRDALKDSRYFLHLFF